MAGRSKRKRPNKKIRKRVTSSQRKPSTARKSSRAEKTSTPRKSSTPRSTSTPRKLPTVKSKAVVINRAPVLTLWTTVVAERLGYDAQEALTLGKAVAGLTAQVKGRHLGIYEERTRKKSGLGEEFWVDICGRAVPAVETGEGIRAVVKDKPIDPEKVAKYLESKFGDNLSEVRAAMVDLAKSLKPDLLAMKAFDLYTAFRPTIPKGARGWGRAGVLDLELVRNLGKQWARRKPS
jgi:hypothetical protein